MRLQQKALLQLNYNFFTTNHVVILVLLTFKQTSKKRLHLKPLFGYCLIKVILLGKVGNVLANDR